MNYNDYADLRATLDDPRSSASALRDVGFALLADLDAARAEVAKVEKVRALHAPVPCAWMKPAGSEMCAECESSDYSEPSSVRWPCATIRALDGAS